MANEQTGSVALLRRIRANLTDPELIAEIDERLALVDAVEWKFQAASLGRYELHLFPHGWPVVKEWAFEIKIATDNVYGRSFPTEEEAKAAAVEAVLDWTIE